MENKLIPNSTQIPNIILDIVIPQISESDGKCLLYICRRTFGFHKEIDRISLSQFINGIKNRDGEKLDNGCGVSRPAVVNALKNLVGSGLVEITRTGNGNYYKINLQISDFNEVVKKVNQLRKLTKSGKESKPKQVNLLNLQKKGNKEKQSISETSSQTPISIIRKYFTEQCKEAKGFEPEMSFAKEGGLLKEKLKRFSVEQIKDLIDKFLNSKVGSDLGYTLSVCLSAFVINQWLTNKLEKAKKQFYRGCPVVDKVGELFVIQNGQWLKFNGDKKEIIWK